MPGLLKEPDVPHGVFLSERVMGSEVQPLVSIRNLRHEGARYARDLWSEARAHYRTASSNLSGVNGFCRKVALAGRGFTLVPDMTTMFIFGYRWLAY